MGARWEKIKADRPITMRQWEIGGIFLGFIVVVEVPDWIIYRSIPNTYVSWVLMQAWGLLVFGVIFYVYRRKDG